ncbi:hypothetical protein [Streptomyces nojiriensis]|uniref:hypothetical protein n=1 Tax=Streptomyces nojiriensis TaxID=66374 RepID=UPI0036557BEA
MPSARSRSASAVGYGYDGFTRLREVIAGSGTGYTGHDPLPLLRPARRGRPLGRDLVVNTAQANHHLAADWLERHLRGRFTVHRVDRMADSHIDATLLALRPGVFLARHDRVRDLLPRPLQGWKFIVPPEPEPAAFPAYGPRDLLLTCPYIDLNVLSVDESTVLVNVAATGVRTVLEAHGFTLDTVRDGGTEDYLT